MASFSYIPPVIQSVGGKFNPYIYNGGTIVAVAGEDFAVIGADTRLYSEGMVQTREVNRLFQLSNQSVMGSCGCWCDTLGFVDVLKQRVAMYEGDHYKTISVASVAQMISVLMYCRRLLPYNISNVLVGLDPEGKGHVYAYDPLGHHECSEYAASGAGGKMIFPVLDNQIGYKNRAIDPKDIPKVTKERAIALISDAFVNVGEREVITGDSLVIKVITKDGIEEIRKELRKD